MVEVGESDENKINRLVLAFILAKDTDCTDLFQSRYQYTPKLTIFLKKLFFAFSDISCCDLSFQKNSVKKLPLTDSCHWVAKRSTFKSCVTDCRIV